MRTHGTLTKWNDERGFGFILPSQGTAEIFVHISAFRRSDQRPQVNEVISFDTETSPDGKLRAIRVMRAGQGNKSVRHPHATGNQNLVNIFKSVLVVVAVVTIGAVGYSKFQQQFREQRVLEIDNPLDIEPASTREAKSRVEAIPTREANSSVDFRSSRDKGSAVESVSFRCDGRTMCSQMKSCDEARYFLLHCPNPMMDGDNDGNPCEQQWCN
ncbi:MAG: cold shock domain-containing protein [Dokdonella sp.]